MKAVMIVNPSAGKEKAVSYKEHLERELSKKYDEVEVLETRQEGDATKFAIDCAATTDLVVAMGGDGTLSEVIMGIAPLEKRPTLAFIPLGTVNEFARALDMPLVPEEVIDEILTYKPRNIDLGYIEDQYFTNSVTIGTIPRAMHEVPSEAKTMFGPFAFVMKGVQTLAENENYHFDITYDGKHWQGEAAIVMIGLTSYIAGLEHFFPNATPDDGLIHVMIIPELGFSELVKLAPDLWKGKIMESEHVEMLTCKTLTVSAKEPLVTNVNGDEGPKLPVEITVKPQFLTVLAPH